MADFLMLMHNDATAKSQTDQWPAYFTRLRARNAFEGGSAISPGDSFRKSGKPGAQSRHLVGYIRIQADSLAQAEILLTGNPVYENGGTVEILPL